MERKIRPLIPSNSCNGESCTNKKVQGPEASSRPHVGEASEGFGLQRQQNMAPSAGSWMGSLAHGIHL